MQVDEVLDWNLLALGIAEYRSGNAAAAASPVAAAEAKKERSCGMMRGDRPRSTAP